MEEKLNKIWIIPDADHQYSCQEDHDDQFPIGLKVLAIDHNVVCLKYLVRLLHKCQYKVTATTEAAEAIRLLKDEKEANFDIIITNVVRHDMDGFKILHIIGDLGMDIPVVMVSANEELEMVKRGVMEGAEAYLLKPLRLQELRNIWQHVLRKKSHHKRPSNPNPNLVEHNNNKLSINSYENKELNDDDDEINNNINHDYDINYVVGSSSSSSKKKPRVHWTKELHDKFLAAYDQLAEKERVPNSILKLMNDPSLSRENIASHLQKHRDTLRKKKKNFNERNPTKSSTTIYNSMSQRNKAISNLRRPLFPMSGHQFQFSNLARSSIMEEPHENQISRTAAAGSYFPVPEFQWFNCFSSNNNISVPEPCDDQYFGFGPNNLRSDSYYPILESKCLNNLGSQTFGNCPIDNVVGVIIPDHQAAQPLALSFPNNNTNAGQCSQMQYDKGNSHGSSLLIGDDLSEIFKLNS